MSSKGIAQLFELGARLQACQSDLPAFFSPRMVIEKIPINSDFRQAGIARPGKMALGC
jgi:hypothetical protein